MHSVPVTDKLTDGLTDRPKYDANSVQCDRLKMTNGYMLYL